MRDAAGIEPGVAEAVARAIDLCEELGAEVEECSLPRSVEYGLPCYYLIAPAEASSNLARYDGVRYGFRADGDDLTEVYERTRDEGFGDEPKRRIMLGTYALSAGYYDAFYGKAQKVRTVIIREHAAVFERFDLIVSADVADGRVPDRRARRRPARDVRLRPADDPVVHRRPARALDPVRALRRACRSGCSWSARSSRRTRSSAPATRWSGRWRSTSSRSGCDETKPSPTGKPVVGLEIHVHLKTRTKMFCRCEPGFGAEPNTRTCPVCLAHPGALPVANRQAVEWTIKLGLALGSEIAERAVFARKNYFYPDNPKGYQISQYDQPLCVGGARGARADEPSRSASCARTSRRTLRRPSTSAAARGARSARSGR